MNCNFLRPAIFTIAPSGASEPFKPTTPPVLVIGLLTGKITSWFFGNSTSFTFSASVYPVTVMHEPSINPPSIRVFIKTGTPPTSYKSLATYFPPGAKLPM